MSNVMRRAVLYCRVSHTKQRDAVYTGDETGHGDFMNRPGMVAVLKHLQDNPQHNNAVIFDDPKRFAREIAAADGGDHD